MLLTRMLATLLQQAAAPVDTANRPRLGGEGEVGTLSDPTSAGAPRERSDFADNDPKIQALELRIKCPCPCGLDVYTCRTTDFTCSYSPEAHKEILAMASQGKSGQQIMDAFVARYGEKALMAPKASGFNLAGYLVPGSVLLLAGASLTWVLMRRQKLAQQAVVAPGFVAPPVDATPDEIARLERALRDADS